MPEHSENATENIMNNIMDTIAENLPKQKSVRFDDGSISDQAWKLFGGQKSVHHILPPMYFCGGTKKICSSVLALATAVWVLFE